MDDNFLHSVICCDTSEKSPELPPRAPAPDAGLSLPALLQETDTWRMTNASHADHQKQPDRRRSLFRRSICLGIFSLLQAAVRRKHSRHKPDIIRYRDTDYQCLEAEMCVSTLTRKGSFRRFVDKPAGRVRDTQEDKALGLVNCNSSLARAVFLIVHPRVVGGIY